MISYYDVIVDLQSGDTGKGKVTHSLCKNGGYTHVTRFNGSNNAGHTIYHDGVKHVTHHIPAGVFYGIKSIIGPGCVLNIEQFFKEMKELDAKNVFVDKRVHIITPEHLEEENKENVIGTTRRGNGPAYRDKYARKGLRAEQVPELKEYLIDCYDEFHEKDGAKILFEGAQGFNLDIDWGEYPYVTSSHCTVGGAILNGVPPQKLRRVFGVCKAYETYVGTKKFEPNNPIFEKIRQEGSEFGATTGRPRQINWLNIKDLIKAININGVTDLIINKLDILEKLYCFNYYDKNEILRCCDDSDGFQKLIKEDLNFGFIGADNITWSRTAEGI